MIGGTEKAFLKAEATELLITWLMPHQQMSPRNGKQHRDDRMTQLFAPLALGQHMDVVGWAAALPAIERVRLPVLLGQCGFHKGGGGPQQGRDPQVVYKQ